MIPLRDNIPSRTTPFINYLILAATTLVFANQVLQPDDPLVEQYGMIPARVQNPGAEIMVPDLEKRKTKERVEVPVGRDRSGRIVYRVAEVESIEEVRIDRPAEPAAVHPWLTLLTCVFLHGGWLHFLGNMWFLWIFGDNVEDCFGHVGYLIFYLLAGVAASAVHLVSTPDSMIPTIGASGAIAGVMGAYFLLYPHARVLTFIPIFFFLYMVVVPAPIFLGVWFLIQFFQGSLQLGDTEATGVAWWAHIGGFVFGAGLAWILYHVHGLRPPVHERYDDHSHAVHYRRPRF